MKIKFISDYPIQTERETQMKKIIFLIALITAGFSILSSDIYAQKEILLNKDTLITGGIYSIELTDGRTITGEITSIRDSSIGIRVGKENFIFRKEIIKRIMIGGSNIREVKIITIDSVHEGKKFKFIGSLLSGLAIPAADFKKTYSTSSGFQISGYQLISKVTGIGGEFQYNNFHGTVSYYTEPYSTDKIETESFNSYMFKFNILAGDLKPENKFVYYFMFGIGLQINSEGNIDSTHITYNTSDTYKEESYKGITLFYGLGTGSFYKISRYIGINLELQFNKIKKYNGFYSIKGGIMFTIF
ncbi:MAG: hypothetical protein IPH77_14865 [Ignavibacteria bacterium]|nr:hypothetical protein [Ignavibacteria bacterium]